MSKNPRIKVVKYGWLGRAGQGSVVGWGLMAVVLVSWAFMTRPAASFSYTFVINAGVSFDNRVGILFVISASGLRKVQRGY